MRIAYLSTFYPFRGGITHFNHSLYNALRKNHEVKAFTFIRQYPGLLFPGKTQYVTENDLIEKIPADRILDTINPLSYLSAASKISGFSPDILIMKYWMPFFAPSLGYVAGKMKNKNCRVISVLDNVIPHEKKFYDLAFSKYFLRRNSGFVVMSETVKQDLLTLKPGAHYLFNEHPLYDHFGERLTKGEACSRLGLPEDRKILLFFGFVRDYKGLDILIETMKSLPEDYYLLVAGEVYGDDKKYYEQVSRLGLADRVQLNLRYIADHEVPLFFSAADVNVLPYRSATQSGILAIAYHFGLPVVVTDVGSLKDSVEADHTGLVAEVAEPAALNGKILEFFQSDHETTFRENILKVRQKNSWENLAEAIVNFSSSLQV